MPHLFHSRAALLGLPSTVVSKGPMDWLMLLGLLLALCPAPHHCQCWLYIQANPVAPRRRQVYVKCQPTFRIFGGQTSLLVAPFGSIKPRFGCVCWSDFGSQAH